VGASFLMLYRAIACAAFLASADALRVDASGMSRRAMLGNAAAIAPALFAAPAFAELKQASDGDVYKRADKGQLNPARVIQRAKDGKLVDGSGASCKELDEIVAVNKEALQFERERLDAMSATEQASVVADVERTLESQLRRLRKVRQEKDCPNLLKPSDADVYRRADEGRLTAARAIERAKTNRLVEGNSATCSELEAIILVDRKAVKYERDKLEAMGGKDPEQAAIVKEIEGKITMQLKKLDTKKKERLCGT